MKILVVAPHFDDEVLGCGGLITRKVAEKNEVYVCVVTCGKAPLFDEKDNERDYKECKKAHKILGVKETYFLDLPAAMLDAIPMYELNGKIAQIVNKVKPDEMYIPHHGDMHNDHKLVADACMVAVRPRSLKPVKKVFAYETLSETDWDRTTLDNAFVPNVFVDITKYLDKKIKAMMAYEGQIQEYPSPRSSEGIKALAMHRGSTVNRKYAESFMLLREID